MQVVTLFMSKTARAASLNVFETAEFSCLLNMCLSNSTYVVWTRRFSKFQKVCPICFARFLKRPRNFSERSPVSIFSRTFDISWRLPAHREATSPLKPFTARWGRFSAAFGGVSYGFFLFLPKVVACQNWLLRSLVGPLSEILNKNAGVPLLALGRTFVSSIGSLCWCMTCLHRLVDICWAFGKEFHWPSWSPPHLQRVNTTILHQRRNKVM